MYMYTHASASVALSLKQLHTAQASLCACECQKEKILKRGSISATASAGSKTVLMQFSLFFGLSKGHGTERRCKQTDSSIFGRT